MRDPMTSLAIVVLCQAATFVVGWHSERMWRRWCEMRARRRDLEHQIFVHAERPGAEAGEG